MTPFAKCSTFSERACFLYAFGRTESGPKVKIVALATAEHR